MLNTVLQIVVRELELLGAFFTHFPNAYGDVPLALSMPDRDAISDASVPRGGDTALWISFPLHDKTGATFTELVVIRPAERTLTLDELDFIESFAIQESVAIENARFHERTLQWQRVESDMASARQVQRSLLPQEMPQIPGYSMAMRSVTCYEVGGDYLDIVPMPSRARQLWRSGTVRRGMTKVFRGGGDGGSDEEFGEDRLLRTFLDCPAATPELVLDSVWSPRWY